MRPPQAGHLLSRSSSTPLADSWCRSYSRGGRRVQDGLQAAPYDSRLLSQSPPSCVAMYGIPDAHTPSTTAVPAVSALESRRRSNAEASTSSSTSASAASSGYGRRQSSQRKAPAPVPVNAAAVSPPSPSVQVHSSASSALLPLANSPTSDEELAYMERMHASSSSVNGGGGNASGGVGRSRSAAAAAAARYLHVETAVALDPQQELAAMFSDVTQDISCRVSTTSQLSTLAEPQVAAPQRATGVVKEPPQPQQQDAVLQPPMQGGSHGQGLQGQATAAPTATSNKGDQPPSPSRASSSSRPTTAAQQHPQGSGQWQRRRRKGSSASKEGLQPALSLDQVLDDLSALVMPAKTPSPVAEQQSHGSDAQYDASTNVSSPAASSPAAKASSRVQQKQDTIGAAARPATPAGRAALSLTLARSITTASSVAELSGLFASYSRQLTLQHVTLMLRHLATLCTRQKQVKQEQDQQAAQSAQDRAGEGQGRYSREAEAAVQLLDRTQRALQANQAALPAQARQLWADLISKLVFMLDRVTAPQAAMVLGAHCQLEGLLMQLQTTHEQAAWARQRVRTLTAEAGAGNGAAQEQGHTQGSEHRFRPVNLPSHLSLNHRDLLVSCVLQHSQRKLGQGQRDGTVVATAGAADAATAASPVAAPQPSGTGSPSIAPVSPTGPSSPWPRGAQLQDAQPDGTAPVYLTPLSQGTPAQLTSLIASLAQLKQSPPRSWWSAYWAAAASQLPRHTTPQLLVLIRSLAHLGATPPHTFLTELYGVIRPRLRSLSMPALCIVAHAAARMPAKPGPGWLAELLQACEDRFDEFDAPAYAQVLHALGRMHHKPPPGWLQEFLDSAACLMHDFSTEELSLLLRGVAYLDLDLDGEWLATLWEQTEPKLRFATGPQLAHIGWALLTKLQLTPPRPWQRAYLAALERRVWSAAGLQKRHALRAAEALVDLEVPDLAAWCRQMNVPVPERARHPREALFSSSAYQEGLPTDQQQGWSSGDEQDADSSSVAGSAGVRTQLQVQPVSSADSSGGSAAPAPGDQQAGPGSSSSSNGSGGNGWDSRDQGRPGSRAPRPRFPGARGRAINARLPPNASGRLPGSPGPQGRGTSRGGRPPAPRQRLWPSTPGSAAGPSRSSSSGNTSSSEGDAHELSTTGRSNSRPGTPAGAVNGNNVAATPGAGAGQPWSASVPDVVRASDSVWDLAGMVGTGRAGDYGAANW